MKRSWLVLVIVAACGAPEPIAPNAPNTPAQAAAAAPAVAALQGARFAEARRIATEVLARDPHSSRAAAVRALATYQAAGEALITQLGAVMDQAESLTFFDHEAGRAAWKQFAAQLDAVDHDLAIAAADPAFSLELCLACWEHDWNGNGQVDDRDRRLFELEYDGQGGELAPGDPRRRPTFRFDAGDIDWARAMIAFQRAGVNLVLAYRWSELDKIFQHGLASRRVTIALIDPGRVKKARELILAGLAFADGCRAEYLAETDDDREWVPNPRQTSHPMPLPMDDAVYATWEGVTGDLRRMLTSEEGLSMREAAALVDPRAALLVPDAYIDLGAMLREPQDIVIDVSDDSENPSNTERILRGLLGHGYRTGMRSSSACAT